VLTFLPKRANIFLILKYFLGALPKGNIVEFGSFRGGMAMMMASICQDLHPDATVYALDTFEGMPTVDPSIDHVHAGSFKQDVNYDEIVGYAASRGLNNIKFVKGLFQDTADAVLREAKTVSLVHIDCDIRSAVEFSYEVVQPYLVDGAYIIFDDANHWAFIGATEVIEDLVIRRDDKRSEQVDPHYVFRHNLR
jgi:predicted O-methyltransferase YrrM